MGSLPQAYSATRSPRARLAGVTPAVLRFPDGQRASGQLQVVSLTGGLLALPSPLDQGSQVRLMFLTGGGSVLGGAEMLSPVATNLQPFRFVSLAMEDRRKLGSTIQSLLHPDGAEQAWMKKLRTASADSHAAERRGVRIAVEVTSLIALGLTLTILLLRQPWLR